VAVYEHAYGIYEGALTPQRWRFLVLPRYAFREVFQSRMFTAFTALCFMLPLVLALLIYLPYNSTFIKTIEAASGGSVSFRFRPVHYFWAFMIPSSFEAFFMALIVGPALISSDLRNNALPLYLARPFSRTDYILGKMSVLILLLSAITWVPGLLLFGLQAYLEGPAWLRANASTGAAIFLGSWIWILLLCLISLALSAYMRWRPLARAAMFGLFISLSALSGIVNFLFGTEWGSLLNISDMVTVIWAWLFGVPEVSTIPPAAAALSLVTFCGLCLGLLARKVRAYEVVK
jgi:ABC-2 type transport system permease protein